MSEMIDRVARAICKSRTCQGISCCQWPAQMGRVNCPVAKGLYDDAARAAIKAMREPTPEMLGPSNPSGLTVYRAMIDAALADPVRRVEG